MGIREGQIFRQAEGLRKFSLALAGKAHEQVGAQAHDRPSTLQRV